MNNLAHHRSSLTKNRRIRALYIEKRQIKAPKNLSSEKILLMRKFMRGQLFEKFRTK